MDRFIAKSRTAEHGTSSSLKSNMDRFIVQEYDYQGNPAIV